MLRRHSQQVPMTVLEKLVKEEEEERIVEEGVAKSRATIQHLSGGRGGPYC